MSSTLSGSDPGDLKTTRQQSMPVLMEAEAESDSPQMPMAFEGLSVPVEISGQKKNGSVRSSAGFKWKALGRNKKLKGRALELDKMIRQEVTNSGTEKSRISLEAQYDSGRWWRNMLCIANGFFGNLLTMIASGLDWDGEKAIETDGGNSLKMVASVLTGILVVQLCEYHRFKMAYLFQTYLRDQEMPFLYLSKDIHVLLIECIVCGFHIPPFCIAYLPDRYMVFMFLRLYLPLRFLRDISPVTGNKAKITAFGFYDLGGTTLNSWLLHARTFIYRKPGTFVLSIMTVIYFVNSFSIYLFERQEQPEKVDYKVSLWYTAVTMFTIGFGDVVAQSDFGRVLAIISGVAGIMLSSFCVTTASSVLNLSDHQKFANDIVSVQEMEHKRLQSAASVIQCWWRLLCLQRENRRDAIIEYNCRKGLIESTAHLRRYRKLRKSISLYGEEPVVLTKLYTEGRFDIILDRILKADRACTNVDKKLKTMITAADHGQVLPGRVSHRPSVVYRSPSVFSTAPLSAPQTPREGSDPCAKILDLLDRLEMRMSLLEEHLANRTPKP